MAETLPAKRYEIPSVGAPIPVQASEDSLWEFSESVRDCVAVVFRQKTKMIVFFLAVVGGALAALLLSPDLYTSEAKLLLRQGRESVALDPTAVTGGPLYPFHKSWETEVNSEMEILRSQELVRLVVETVGPEVLLAGESAKAGREEDVDPLVWAAQVLSTRLQVELFKKTNVVALRYQADNPDTAWRVVSSLIDVYQVKHFDVHRTAGAYEFFLDQTDRLRRQLEDAEIVLRNFKNVFGIASLDKQQSIVLSRIRSIRDRVETSEAGMASARARVAAIKDALDRDAGKRKGMLIPARDFHDLQSNLLQEETTLSSAEAELAALRGQLSSAQQELQNLNDSEVRLRQMERDRQMLSDKYHKYSENLEQARIDEALEAQKISNISVVQPATKPAVPDPADKRLKLAMAVVFGAVGALGLAFAAEYVDHTLKRPDELEQKAEVPFLVFVPDFRWRSMKPRVQKSRQAVGGQGNGWDLPAATAEYFEILRDRLLRRLPADLVAPVVLGVTSSRAGEGVTSVAAGLSVMLARHLEDGRVLYVDANYEKSQGSGVFGMKAAPGAAELVRDEAGTVKVTEKNLYEFSGSEHGEPSETLALTRYEGLMPFIRNRDYSFVLFDLPPVSQGRPVVQMCGSMDGILLVVEAEKVRWEVVRRVKAVLEEADARILGGILNKRRFHVPRWLSRRL